MPTIAEIKIENGHVWAKINTWPPVEQEKISIWTEQELKERDRELTDKLVASMYEALRRIAYK